MENSARIVYVCSLCLRQYDLQEDLRGHLVYFHGYEPISTPSVKNKTAKTSTKEQTAAGSNSQDKQTVVERSENSEPPASELQPMPFKDFRLVLRANMLEPYVCPYYYHKLLTNSFVKGAPLERNAPSSSKMLPKWSSTVVAIRVAVFPAANVAWNCPTGGGARLTCGKPTRWMWTY